MFKLRRFISTATLSNGGDSTFASTEGSAGHAAGGASAILPSNTRPLECRTPGVRQNTDRIVGHGGDPCHPRVDPDRARKRPAALTIGYQRQPATGAADRGGAHAHQPVHTGRVGPDEAGRGAHIPAGLELEGDGVLMERDRSHRRGIELPGIVG